MKRAERRAQQRRLRKHPVVAPVPTAGEFTAMVQIDPARALEMFCAVRDSHREAK